MKSDTFPDAIIAPAHPTNYYTPAGHGGVPNKPRGLVLHTPEEPADGYAYTPVFFADPNRQASTHYFISFTGDIYQMVPENCMAIANGVKGKPCPPWADPATSLNWQTINVEIEGYAAKMAKTCPPGTPQWKAIVRWIRVLSLKYAIPIDRIHDIGHYQVANDRTDPGTLDIDGLVREAQGSITEILEEDSMTVPHVEPKEPQHTYRSYMIIGGKLVWIPSGELRRAYAESGYIAEPPVKVPVADLKAIPLAAGSPAPDAI